MASFISQLTDAMNLCSQPVERQVRTTIDPPMAPEEAMKLLKDRARGKGAAPTSMLGGKQAKTIQNLFSDVFALFTACACLVGNTLVRACQKEREYDWRCIANAVC